MKYLEPLVIICTLFYVTCAVHSYSCACDWDRMHFRQTCISQLIKENNTNMNLFVFIHICLNHNAYLDIDLNALLSQ